MVGDMEIRAAQVAQPHEMLAELRQLPLPVPGVGLVRHHQVGTLPAKGSHVNGDAVPLVGILQQHEQLLNEPFRTLAGVVGPPGAVVVLRDRAARTDAARVLGLVLQHGEPAEMAHRPDVVRVVDEARHRVLDVADDTTAPLAIPFAREEVPGRDARAGYLEVGNLLLGKSLEVVILANPRRHGVIGRLEPSSPVSVIRFALEKEPVVTPLERRVVRDNGVRLRLQEPAGLGRKVRRVDGAADRHVEGDVVRDAVARDGFHREVLSAAATGDRIGDRDKGVGQVQPGLPHRAALCVRQPLRVFRVFGRPFPRVGNPVPHVIEEEPGPIQLKRPDLLRRRVASLAVEIRVEDALDLRVAVKGLGTVGMDGHGRRQQERCNHHFTSGIVAVIFFWLPMSRKLQERSPCQYGPERLHVPDV